MNKKAFTLVELLAAIVLIAIIMTLVFPSALKLQKKNEGKICDEYRKMMIEYAQISEKNDQDYIDLIDLDELDEVKDNCNGYVVIDHSSEVPTYQAYLSCRNGCRDDGYTDVTTGSKGVTLIANDVTMTYGDNSAAFNYSLNYLSPPDNPSENPLTSTVSYTVQDIHGNKITINNSTPIGVYTIIPYATVKSNYRLSKQNGTLTISPKKCDAPTNVMIDSNGNITWTNSSNCASATHQIKVGNGIWSNASSGVNKKSEIISEIGSRVISVKALPLNANYSESDAATGTKNVCNAVLASGNGISSVSGEGHYLEGSSIEISANVQDGYTWGNWVQTSDTTQVVSTNNTYTTNTCNVSYTAIANGNQYTINYIDNLFVSKSQYRNDNTEDVSAVYTENGSYLTINGTLKTDYTKYFMTNIWNIEQRSFTAGDEYQITINYIEGTFTRSPKFVFELTTGTTEFSDRDTEPKSYVMVDLPSEGQTTATYTVPASRASANRLKFRLYQDSASKIVFTGYKVQIIITKVHSKTVTYGEPIGEMDTASKTGFTFLGWYTELNSGNEVTSDSIYNIQGDQTLYAHYYYHKLHIRYKSDCYSTISWCGPTGSNAKYSMDSKCFALYYGDRIISSYGYGQYAGYKNGLMNWNNTSAICFYRSGQNGIDSGEDEWKSTNTGKTYSMSDLYNAASIATKENCDLKTVDDCMVTLKVNWMGASSGGSSGGSTCCPSGGHYYGGYCYTNSISGLPESVCTINLGYYYISGVCYRGRYSNSC